MKISIKLNFWATIIFYNSYKNLDPYAACWHVCDRSPKLLVGDQRCATMCFFFNFVNYLPLSFYRAAHHCWRWKRSPSSNWEWREGGPPTSLQLYACWWQEEIPCHAHLTKGNTIVSVWLICNFRYLLSMLVLTHIKRGLHTD